MDRVRELYQRLRLLMTFARILRVDDSGDLQVMQLEGFVGEIRESVPRIGQWGFASNPPLDSQAVVLATGADRGQLVVIGVEDRRTRPKNLPVGTAQIHSIGGNRVTCKPDGTIEIFGTVGNLTINPAGAITINGLSLTVAASGAVSITGGAAVTINGSSVVLGAATTIDGKAFLAHTHTSNVVGTPTGPVL